MERDPLETRVAQLLSELAGVKLEDPGELCTVTVEAVVEIVRRESEYFVLEISRENEERRLAAHVVGDLAKENRDLRDRQRSARCPADWMGDEDLYNAVIQAAMNAPEGQMRAAGGAEARKLCTRIQP